MIPRRLEFPFNARGSNRVPIFGKVQIPNSNQRKEQLLTVNDISSLSTQSQETIFT
jgi:hypothetical protein